MRGGDALRAEVFDHRAEGDRQRRIADRGAQRRGALPTASVGRPQLPGPGQTPRGAVRDSQAQQVRAARRPISPRQRPPPGSNAHTADSVRGDHAAIERRNSNAGRTSRPGAAATMACGAIALRPAPGHHQRQRRHHRQHRQSGQQRGPLPRVVPGTCRPGRQRTIEQTRRGIGGPASVRRRRAAGPRARCPRRRTSRPSRMRQRLQIAQIGQHEAGAQRAQAGGTDRWRRAARACARRRLRTTPEASAVRPAQAEQRQQQRQQAAAARRPHQRGGGRARRRAARRCGGSRSAGCRAWPRWPRRPAQATTKRPARTRCRHSAPAPSRSCPGRPSPRAAASTRGRAPGSAAASSGSSGRLMSHQTPATRARPASSAGARCWPRSAPGLRACRCRRGSAGCRCRTSARARGWPGAIAGRRASAAPASHSSRSAASNITGLPGSRLVAVGASRAAPPSPRRRAS